MRTLELYKEYRPNAEEKFEQFLKIVHFYGQFVRIGSHCNFVNRT